MKAGMWLHKATAIYKRRPAHKELVLHDPEIYGPEIQLHYL